MTTNREFLGALFPGAIPWVCHFPNDPKKDPHWAGVALINGMDIEWPDANTYFSIMSVRDPKKGRKGENFNALHVIMVDDVGTKVAKDKLPNLAPTWILQTSVKEGKKNFQYGYALDAPCADQPRAKCLIDHLTACGFSDAGAGGVNRYARLPTGSNTKDGEVQPHKLVIFDPNVRYSMEQLEQAFGVDTNSGAPTDSRPRLGVEHDPVLKVLDARGMVKKKLAEGKWDITCPWVHEHTGGIDDGAAYFEAHTNGYAGATFKCLHGHCAGRTIRNMREFLDIESLVDFDSVMHLADALTEKSTPDNVAVVLRGIHSARLRPVEQLAALREIKTKTKIGLGALKEELAAIARRETTDGDIGLTVAQAVLDRFYAGGQHLVRTQDGSFWAYGGTHWARITDEQVKHAILEVIEADVSPGAGIFSALMDSAFRLLVAMRAASGDVLRLAEEPLPVINCKNGELWLGEDGTYELRPHRADSFLTYVLGVEYDPAARCPRFDRALLGIFWSVRRDDKDNVMAHSAAMVRHLYEIIGYAIQPRRWLAVWVMFIGPGNGGKSRVVQTVTEKLMNPRTVFADRISDVEGDRFKRGALAGKLVLLDDDVDADTKLPDGFLKAISERKLLSGQLKFRDSFEFIACCLPILLANNPPTSKDLSWGLRRRAHIVPFERIFHKDRATAVKEGDPRAVDNPKLFPHVWQHEMPGVLNRALQGLQRLRARGRFEEPRACVEARRRWLAAANPLVAFVSEECESSPDLSTLLRDFYVSYQEWAKEAGVRSIEPRNTIKRHLEGLGYKTVASGHGTAVRGLRVQFVSARGDIG